MKNKHNYWCIDKEKIRSFLDGKSQFMNNYILEHYDSEFLLIYKYLSHSDLINKGKRNGNKETLDQNYLYYLSVDEMVDLEKQQNTCFESAKQSNIGLPTIFFNALGVPQLQRRKGPQTTQHNHISINDYANVYLVNDSVKYFNIEYTKKVFSKLGKHPNWENDDLHFDLNESGITPIKLTHAIHGIGTAEDDVFKKLRCSMFKNDIFMTLIESRPKGEKNLFIILDKNPKFYTILGLSNEKWEKYITKEIEKSEELLKTKTIVELDELQKSRKQQAKWRNLLAEEMMNYSTIDGEVFCPLTYLAVDFDNAGTLFRASHIKAFEECNPQEAYDLNNGLLLCANADALFDKHLITINDEKELVFSFLLDNDYKLKAKLLLNQPIFKAVLNNERMKYIAYHRNVFNNLEKERKQNLF